MCDIVSNLYSKHKIRIRLGENRTDFFDSMVGVRQGDVFGLNLLKIFISDLPKYLNGSSDPVFLNSLPLDCLLYADDIVLLSGLQENNIINCMNFVSTGV